MSTTLSVEPLTDPPRRRTESGRWHLLVRLHFYAGVFVAPFLAIAALTGLLYTLTPQLDRIVYGHELTVRAVGDDPYSLADQVATARRVHPEGTVASVVPAASADATTQVVLAVPGLGEKQRTVYVDPYSNKVRGELDTWYGSTPLTTWLDDLHRNLHLGEVGRVYSELAASWLWVIAAGGLVLWIGRRRAYRRRGARHVVAPDLSASGVRRTRGWHASVGVWLSVGLFFLAATGLTWSHYAGANFKTLRASLGADAPVLDTSTAASGGHHGASGIGGGDLTAVDRVLAAARDAGLDGPVTISPPADKSSAWTVAQTDNTWPVRLDAVAIDPVTGAVTARTNWADYPVLAKLSTLGVQAHMGLLFGVANQVLLAALALGLLCVIVWGYRMWWQRRPIRVDRRRAVGSPPARGAWRSVSRPTLLIGVVVVALVGWAMPVLGVSLVLFLLVDAVVSFRKESSS